MKIALGIYRLEPRGGLEDHCVRIGQALSRRGHRVSVLSMAPGEVGSEMFEAIALDDKGLPHSNHRRMRYFADSFAAATRHGYDLTVSFQPVPGVQVLFCADPVRGALAGFKRLLPRQRTYAALEAACFGQTTATRIILLSQAQERGYRARYQTPADRIRVVPPSIDPAKRQPHLRQPGFRIRAREELGIASQAPALLWIGLQPEIKGLDRVVEALPRMRRASLLIAGLGPSDRKARGIRARIAALGLGDRVRWLGYLAPPALLEAMAVADVLAHPARLEVTGGVIVEAIINGLPAVATDCCGFAHHVSESGAGVVIPSAFDNAQFVQALERCTGPEGHAMSERGMAYGRAADLFSGIERAVGLIEASSWTQSQ